MILIKNFRKYVPEGDDKKELKSLNISFLKSECGLDWYDCQKDFKDNTIKIVFDEDNVITSYSEDVSSLYPVDKSVAEIELGDATEDLKLDSSWVFNEGNHTISKRVYSSEEIKSQVDSVVKSKISDAMVLINPLQFAKDLEMATDEEKERLKNLQKYVVLLNRVSIQESYPTGVVWPEIPTT